VPVERGGGDECPDCYAASRQEYRQREFEQVQAKRQARIEAGKAVCSAHNNAGHPCGGMPVRGTTLCSGHTDDPDIFAARDMGKGYVELALGPEERDLRTAGMEPRLRAVVLAYATLMPPATF
jgi:hypothetical protein